MSEYTPDTLRGWADEWKQLGGIAQALLRDAADAWDVDINLIHIASDQVARVIEQNDSLRQRLYATTDAWEEVEEELRLTTEMETKLNDECVELRQQLEAQQKEWAKHYETDTNTILDLRQRLEADIEAYERCEKSYDHLSIENVNLRQRLEAAQAWRRTVIEAWNAWGIRGDSPGMMQFVAALAAGEYEVEQDVMLADTPLSTQKVNVTLRMRGEDK